MKVYIYLLTVTTFVLLVSSSSIYAQYSTNTLTLSDSFAGKIFGDSPSDDLDDYQNGAAIDLFNNLPTSLTYDIYSYDKRFKMHQVKAFGFPWWTDTFYTDTSIVDATDYSGYYQELKGTFNE